MLTKQQAIEEHRKMWNWIAENGYEIYKKNLCRLGDIKEYYIFSIYSKTKDKAVSVSYPFFNCFCCEYAIQETDTGFIYNRKKCAKCPLFFNDYYCDSDNSPFYLLNEGMFFYRSFGKQEFKSLALQIANLPERK